MTPCNTGAILESHIPGEFCTEVEGTDMSVVAEEPVTIDNGLRFVFFGLEIGMGIYFSGAECERVFTDSVEVQVSAKRYRFHTSPRVVVTGRVDDYEHETIWLRIEGLRNADKILLSVIEGAKFHAARLPE